MTGQELMAQFSKATERMGSIEKHIESLSKTSADHALAITKVFGPGRQSPIAMPGLGQAFDGAGRDFAQHYDPKRCKSIGSPEGAPYSFGEWLVNQAKITAPEKFGVTTKESDAIRKSFEEMGAYFPSAGPPSEVVNKAWQDRARTKAPLAEGALATGGAVTPPVYGNELLRLMNEDSWLVPQLRQVPMTGPEFYYPTLDQTLSPPTDGSAFYGGLVWRNLPEAVNIRTQNETEPVLRQVHLVARTFGGIVRASNQLMADNTAALDTVLTTLFKEAGAWLKDHMTLNGNGAGQPLGIRNAPALIAITKQTAGSFVLLDAANMMAQMLPASWNKCIFAAHPSVLPQLMTMTTSTTATPNQFLVWLNPMGSGREGPAAAAPPAILLGRPLYFTEKLPKLTSGSNGSVLLLDPDKILMGDRMAIQIESSIYPYWETAQVGWRIMLRFDTQPEINGPVILSSANDGSNYKVSPYVSLSD